MTGPLELELPTNLVGVCEADDGNVGPISTSEAGGAAGLGEDDDGFGISSLGSGNSSLGDAVVLAIEVNIRMNVRRNTARRRTR